MNRFLVSAPVGVAPLLAQTPPPSVPLPVLLKPNTDVVVRTMDKIDTSIVHEKNTFHATIAKPVIQDGIEVIPVGEECTILVANVKHAGKLKGQNTVELQLSEIKLDGIVFPIETELNQQSAYSRGKDTGKIAAGFAAIGAIAGALANPGGPGWKVGAAGGGALGVFISSRMPQKKLVLPVETELTFTLRRASDLGGHE